MCWCKIYRNPRCWFIVVVRSLSHVWLFATPWTAAWQASLSFTISQNLLKLMSTKSIMPSNHFILCCLLLFLPSIFPSVRVFSNALAPHIRWPKYWSFSFSINPSSEYSRLIFFKTEPTENWGRTMHSSCGYVFWDCVLEARIRQEQQQERNPVVFYYIIYLIFNLVFFLA